MNEHSFDDQIRDVFNEGDFEYNPDNWQALRKQLDPPAGRRISLLPFLFSWKGGVAACLILALTMFLVWPSVPVTEQPHTAATQPAKTPAATVQPQATGTGSGEAATMVPAATQQPAITATPVARKGKQQLILASAVHKQVTTTVANFATADTAIPAPEKPLVQKPATKTESRNLANQEPAAKEPLNPNLYPNFPELPAARHEDPINSLGLTGGYNRGMANSGFALGVNASTRLSNRLSLEGDVAYVRNSSPRSTADVSDVQYRAMSSAFSDGAKTVQKIDVDDISKISYLQFAPSLNYRVSKRLHLGVGADLQQMVRDEGNENVVYLKNNEMKVLPRTDIGYSGKVNYNINNRIRAGLLYREGLQSALDKKYFNRRYLQFTFQYALFQR